MYDDDYCISVTLLQHKGGEVLRVRARAGQGGSGHTASTGRGPGRGIHCSVLPAEQGRAREEEGGELGGGE